MAKKIDTKRILIPHGYKKDIATICGCSVESVRLALHGVTKSELTNRIRQTAIKEFGGMVVK